MPTQNIELFADKHAIEEEQFTIVFRSPIDSADEGRFNEKRAEIEEIFGAIDEPAFFQVVLGDGQKRANPILKVMTEFARNGKPQWSGQFGENAISVTCKQYTNWEDVWPQVKERLNLLLSCIDPFKLVASIDYLVTDTLKEKKLRVVNWNFSVATFSKRDLGFQIT